jgi:hypothetical protein
MTKRVERDALSFNPDLVVLEVGLNDVFAGLGAPLVSFAAQVAALMNSILKMVRS